MGFARFIGRIGGVSRFGIDTGLPATPLVASAKPSNFRFVLGDPARRA
jgi:hypothetical protein